MIIGITGNLGSGKSTVSQMFAELGAEVIDADKVAHELYSKDRGLCVDLAAVFGEEILNFEKYIDRKALARAVFLEPNKFHELNAIVHPAIEKVLREKAIEARKDEGKLLVIEAAVLIETGWDKIVDIVIVVVAPRDIRIKRCIDRGMSPKKIKTILGFQLAQAKKVAFADYIIDNSASLEKTKSQVKIIWDEINIYQKTFDSDNKEG